MTIGHHRVRDPDERNKHLCEGCSLCCEHVTIHINKPRKKSDFDEIIWYVLHHNVYVFIDGDGDWFVEFRTPCSGLGKNQLCTTYKERPDVCREYNQDECEKNGEGEYYTEFFRSKEDIMMWMKKNTRIRGIS